jgi:hypothetical protein
MKNTIFLAIFMAISMQVTIPALAAFSAKNIADIVALCGNCPKGKPHRPKTNSR